MSVEILFVGGIITIILGMVALNVVGLLTPGLIALAAVFIILFIVLLAAIIYKKNQWLNVFTLESTNNISANNYSKN